MQNPLSSIRKCFAWIHDLFYPKCDYYDTCPNRDENNCTCLNGGGSFCGKWREFEGIGRD
jgi:hypothetical protein